MKKIVIILLVLAVVVAVTAMLNREGLEEKGQSGKCPTVCKADGKRNRLTLPPLKSCRKQSFLPC